jgi:hypothetical protein
MQYQELVTNASFLIKSGAGYLQGIVVNAATGTSPTIQVWDNVSAAAPAIAGGTAAFAVPAAGSALVYDCHFSKGLFIVIGGTFSGSLTVSFY